MALLLLGLAYGAGQAFDRLMLDAYDMHEIVALELFDIGGTTYFSGPRPIARAARAGFPRSATRHCYTRQAVDSYIWGRLPRDRQAGAGRSLRRKMFHAWLGAIANAPLAY